MLVRRFSQAFRAVPRAPVTAQLPVSTAVSLRFCAAASTPERIVGTVDQWHDEKGFGFVKDSVGMTYFVHFRDLSVVSSGYRALAKGQSIQFTSAKVGGKWRAEEVTSEDGSPLPSGPPKPVSSTAAAGEEGSEDAAAGSENSAWDEGSAAADGAADGAGTPSGGRDKERKEYKPMVRSHGGRSRGATTTDTSNEHRHRKGHGDGAARHDSRREATTHHAKFDTPVSTAVSAADVVEPSSPVSEYQRGFLEGYHAAMVAALQLREQGLQAQGGHSAATSGTPPQQQQQQQQKQQQQQQTSHRWHVQQGHHQHQKQHQGGGRGGDQQQQQQQQRHNNRHDMGSTRSQHHHQHQQHRSHNGGRQNGYQQQQQRQDHRQQRHDQRGGGHSGGRSHHQGGNRQYGQQQQHEQQQWRQQQNHGGSRSQRHQNQASDTSGSNDGGSGANWSGW